MSRLLSLENSQTLRFISVFLPVSSRLLGHLRTLVPKKKAGAEETRILIFALYKKEATRVEGMLRSKGFSVGGLHGDLSQSARMEALHNFKTGTTGLLVATDVAARGLDIPNVAAVINYTFPLTIEDYIHRIGRTGMHYLFLIIIPRLTRAYFRTGRKER